jgi:hypothetical protein
VRNAAKPIPGAAVDAAIASLLLDTLTPHALEVALTVQTELDTPAAEAGFICTSGKGEEGEVAGRDLA